MIRRTSAIARRAPHSPLLLALALAACSGRAPSVPREPARASTAGRASPAQAALVVPEAPVGAPLERRLVASGLRNPRGMQPLAPGTLLVSEAGTGAPGDENSGRLVRLRDGNADGDYLDAGEQQVLLDAQPSKNVMHIVRRDEVFGMAGMAEGDGTVLVALAFFGGPSTVLRVDGDQVTRWTSTHGNLNDIAFDPRRKAWFGVASTSDEVVRLRADARAERVLKIPPLPNGQDPVPAYLRHDPISGELLVTLFTGSPEGEEGGLGVELIPRAGGIIGVDPDSKRLRWVVSGLTVPTDLEVTPDGTIYVLEFCDGFLDPVETHEQLYVRPSHGGFKRFSGRLLRIDRATGQVAIVATGLDTPTNLALDGDSIYVAQGMGTPGRPIPGPGGTLPLSGFIDRIALKP
jgi:glucose/arabinose dehydrogenase